MEDAKNVCSDCGYEGTEDLCPDCGGEMMPAEGMDKREEISDDLDEEEL